MLIRAFIHIIRPSNEQLRNTKNWLSRFIIKVYQYLLSLLKKSYLHYAISDTILLDNGNIKIIHEFRDLEFESELKRNGVDIRPLMLSTSIPVNAVKSKRCIWYSYFKFKDLLSIYVNNVELFIKHDSSISINGNMFANIKKSSSSDIICRSTIEQTVEKKHKHSQLQRGNQFSKDTIPPHNNIKPQKNSESIDIKPIFIERHGFDIDTTF